MKKYIIPILYTIGIILFGALLSSILYYFNITSNKFNSSLLYLISVSAIFIGSFILSKSSNKKGIITGILYFIFWFIIMFILSILVFKPNLEGGIIIYYLILLLFSILGGIIGKNNKKESDDL